MSVFIQNGKAAPKLFEPMYKMVNVQLVSDGSGTTSQGGIIVPDSSNWRSAVAKVIAVGPKCEQVREGDVVAFSPAIKPLIVRYGGYETLLLHEEQLSGIVERSNP